MIRVTFSGNCLNVSLPKGWHELTPSELKMVFRFMTVYDADVAPTAIFCRLANAKIIRESSENKMLVSFRLYRRMCINTYISPEQMASYLKHLAWLSSPGNVPVRLPKIAGNKAVDAQLHGMSFGDYLRLESLYQGYLQSQNQDALLRMANILYKGRCKIKKLDDADTMCVFNWFAQIKGMFADTFKHFFRATGGSDIPEMIDVMNAQIRALTGGDVTKEKEILEIDCWRALTELDAKARETEEFNKQLKKHER